MKTTLIFKVILYDSAQILGNSSVSFFQDVNGRVASVASESEQSIITWIMSDVQIRKFVLGCLKLDSNTGCKVCVREPLISNAARKPGDIDILLCEDRKLSNAVAFQCKRVKVVSQNTDSDVVNKIESISDGVRQANATREMGFYNTYLCLIIQTDGRMRKDNNFAFRGPTRETFSKIYDFPKRDEIDDDVGVIFIEISQPTGKNIEEACYIGVCVDKWAKPVEQPRRITEHIRNIFS